MRRTESTTEGRALAAGGVLACGLLAGLMRLLHLANPDYYYILSQDSHFFHWQAGRVLAGESIPLAWHGGLTYPLAYGARLAGYALGMAEGDALTLVGKLLPPAIGVAGMLLVYWAVSRMYSWRVGLGAAFIWSVMGHVYWTQAAGYLDRDGLSMTLLAAGVFLYHDSRKWRLPMAGTDAGWVLGALAVLAVMALLVLEWLWLGGFLLAVVLVAAVCVEAALGLVQRCVRDLDAGVDEASLLVRLPRHALAALWHSYWRPLALVLVLGFVVVLFKPGLSYVGEMAGDVAGGAVSGTQEVGELRGLQARDLWLFLPMAVPLGIGIYVAITRHRKADLLCLAWLAGLMGLALFAGRLVLYAAPAACVLGGLGLARVWRLQGVPRSPRYVGTFAGALVLPSRRLFRTCLGLGLMVLMLVPYVAGAYRAGGGRIAADDDWEAALGYLKGETPSEAVVMSWWDYGYWILDMADRRPVVDNGYYGWDEERLEDVGRAYCTQDPAEAVGIMRRYGAGYLVFSRWEVAILPSITRHGLGNSLGDGATVPDDLEGSLFYRCLYEGFQGGEGLTRVYPPPDVEAPAVVVLGLAAAPQGGP